MELDDIKLHGCKFFRIDGNGAGRINSSARLGSGRKVEGMMNPSVEGEKEPKRLAAASAIDGLYSWPSSRIVRVSRASGGKDRHSKVLTSKGLRDRRVRLSVNTAIQFYDLQDRLGYDQPSKAVEWLLKAATSSIHELPPISCVFPQFTDEKRSCNGASYELRFDTAEVVANCGSPSVTSEGSGLSLSRSESRVKARDRAKERVAVKQKEKDAFSQTTSFTELLSVGLNHLINNDHNSGEDAANESQFFLSNGLFGPQTTSRSGHMFLSSPLSSFSLETDHNQEMQPFSLVPEHLASIGESNGLTGFNRGTLQSNSSSGVPHLQRFPPSFFLGATASMESHHQFLSGFDSRKSGPEGKTK